MKTYSQKFVLLRPYIRIVLVSVIIVNIIYYFICIYNNPVYNFAVSNYLLPTLFALVVQITVVLPFTNTFSLPEKQNRFKLNFLLFVMLCLPILASVAVMRMLCSSVITVNTISEINPDSNDRFFKIIDFDIARNKVGENFWTERNHRKHGKDYLSLHLELAAPVQEKQGTKNNFTYWFCLNYERSKNDMYLKPGEIEQFKKESLEEFRLPATVNNIAYVEKIPEKWVADKKLEAINDIMYRGSKTKFVVLEPSYTSRPDKIMVRCLIFIVAFCVNIGIFCALMWKTNKLEKLSTKVNWTTKKS